MAMAPTSVDLGQNVDSKILNYIDIEKLSETNLKESFISGDSTVALLMNSKQSQGNDNDESEPSSTTEMSMIVFTEDQKNPSSSTSSSNVTTLSFIRMVL